MPEEENLRKANKIVTLLDEEGFENLANLMRGTKYELRESSQYGSLWNAFLTTVVIYSPMKKFKGLEKLGDDEREKIQKAFLELHPPEPGGIEISHVEFRLDEESIPDKTTRDVSFLDEVDFHHIEDQIHKCDSKVESGDYEGAISSARSLIEAVFKYILDSEGIEYAHDEDMTSLYDKVIGILDMHPEDYQEKTLKKILSGCFKIVHGIAQIRNVAGDSHGKSENNYYRPSERHARLVIEVTKAFSDFLYASYKK